MKGLGCFLLSLYLLSSCVENASQTTPPEVVTLVDNLYGGTGGMSVDASGYIYSSDFGPFLGSIPNFQPATRVFRISPDGQVATFAEKLAGSSGSDFDLTTGTLYQSNIRGGFILALDPAGKVDTVSTDSIVAPVGVYYDPEEIVVCNCGNNTLRKVDGAGNSRLFAESELFKCPNGITKTPEGNYFVSNFFDGAVLKITPEGEVSTFVEIPGNNNGHLVYRDGYLWVVARGAHQIYKVSLAGKVDLYAGSGKKGRKDGSLLDASFCYPNDLEFSPDGKYLYLNEVADTLSNGRILTPTAIRRLIVR